MLIEHGMVAIVSTSLLMMMGNFDLWWSETEFCDSANVEKLGTHSHSSLLTKKNIIGPQFGLLENHTISVE